MKRDDVVFAILGLAVVRASAADWPGEFKSVLPQPTANQLNKVVFEAGGFHVLGNLGTHLHSADGTAWTLEPVPADDDLWSYAEVGSVRVLSGLVHGANGPATGTLMTSTGGGDWQRQVLPEGTYVFGQSVNGVFLGSGYVDSHTESQRAALFSSADGVVWSEIPLPPEYTALPQPYLGNIVFGNGQHVALGRTHVGGTTYSPFALTSADGETWVFSGIASDRPPTSLAFGNGLFVGVGGSGGTTVFTSANGTDWNVATDGLQRMGLVFGNGYFHSVAVQLHPSPVVSVVRKSADGIDWSGGPVGDTLPFNLAYGNGVLVAAGAEGALFSSVDGESWVWRAGPTRPLQAASALVHGDGTFVALGNRDRAPLFSNDGEAWQSAAVPDPIPQLSGAAHGKGRFVAISILTAPGALAASETGTSWQLIALPAGMEGTVLKAIVHGGEPGEEKFLVLGERNAQAVILSSSTGLSWQDGTPTTPPFTGVTPSGMFDGPGTFHLLANDLSGDRVLLVSTDGETWSQESTSGLPVTARTPMFRNGRYFASDTTAPGRLYVSTDARQWNPVTLPAETIVNDLAHGFGVYIAAGSGGVLFSEDALRWRELPELGDRPWRSVAYGNRGFNLLSQGGGILRLDLSEVRARLAAFLPGQSVQFNLLSQPGDRIEIHHSADLKNWDLSRTVEVEAEATWISEPGGAVDPQHFWKAVLLPASSP